MIYAVVVLGVIAAFVWWRYTSVARGARQRNDQILDVLTPLGEKLASKQPVSTEEVRALAARPHLRHMLHRVLSDYTRTELFPSEYLDTESQAAAALAYWMMHPNELAEAPAQMELIETVHRSVGGREARFLVFRYRMPDTHWTSKDGWLLGLSGPFFGDEVPYGILPGAFSRVGDKHGQADPAKLVDWYMSVAGLK